MNKKLTRFYNIGDKPMSSFNSIYYFQVDDGDEETDIYLSPKEKTTQTFAIKCNNSNTPTFSGDLRAGEKYTFDFHFYSYDFATITIVQKREGEEELRIEYLNIPVEKRNEDHFERHFF